MGHKETVDHFGYVFLIVNTAPSNCERFTEAAGLNLEDIQKSGLQA